MKLRILGTLAGLSLLGCAVFAGCGEDTGATAVIEDTGTDPQSETTPIDAPASETTDGTAGDTTMTGDTTTPGDTTPPVDAPPPGSMKCAATTCNISTQDCCITGGSGVCVTKGASCPGARYSCTSKANCMTGQVCCVSGAGTGGASCSAPTSCPSTTTCDSDADCGGKLKRCVDIGAGIKQCST